MGWRNDFMDLIERLQKIPLQIINFILLMSIAIPLVHPMGLPLKIDPLTKAAYDAIEAMPEGSVAVFDYSIAPQYVLEMGPACQAMTYQMFKRNFKIIYISCGVDGPIFVEKDIPPIAETLGKKYGIDYIHLGYYAGAEMGLTAFLADISNVFTKDFHDTPIEELQLTQTVKNFEQIDMAIYTGGGADMIPAWVRQANTAYGIKLNFIPAGAMVPYVLPYYPDQIEGVVGGLRGSAEYELLTRRPGVAIAGMDSLSLSFVLLIVLVLLCNLGTVRSLLSKGGEG